MSQQYISINSQTVKATAVLTANRFVTTLGAVPAANAAVLGVTRSGAAINELVCVDILGSSMVEAGGAISAGATLAVDSSGRVVTWSTGVKVGTALQAATASGQIIEVNLIQDA